MVIELNPCSKWALRTCAYWDKWKKNEECNQELKNYNNNSNNDDDDDDDSNKSW